MENNLMYNKNIITMKKKIKFLLTLMLVISVSGSLLSCGGNDDGDKSGGGYDSSIVQNLTSHKWCYSWSEYKTNSYSGEEFLVMHSYTFYFINNYHGVLYMNDNGEGVMVSNYAEFDYTIDGIKIHFSQSGSDLSFGTYYDSFLVLGEDVYEAQCLTNSDYEIMKKYSN